MEARSLFEQTSQGFQTSLKIIDIFHRAPTHSFPRLVRAHECVFQTKSFDDDDDNALTCERKHFSVVSAIRLRAIYHYKFMCITLGRTKRLATQ